MSAIAHNLSFFTIFKQNFWSPSAYGAPLIRCCISVFFLGAEGGVGGGGEGAVQSRDTVCARYTTQGMGPTDYSNMALNSCGP